MHAHNFVPRLNVFADSYRLRGDVIHPQLRKVGSGYEISMSYKPLSVGIGALPRYGASQPTEGLRLSPDAFRSAYARSCVYNLFKLRNNYYLPSRADAGV